ncbi:PREDICTED: tyrosine-protein kinase HCK [Cyprinodon variegatus]|uniref:Tyrosine-protein kinase n=1 Tax=Cyprinodon variegatus TaxID=28743 RepID=A0A3Q2DWL8_CYPVA|nr:PREDICTED: tyrosine-protein kinase HCK [Cyprinodon variegatus]
MCDCLQTVSQRVEDFWRSIFKKKPGDDEGDRVDEASTKRPSSTPPPPPERQSDSSIYTGIWSFEARHKDELSFQEGDLLEVISRNGDWWMARRVGGNGHVGIVPHNYLAKAESVELQPWFYGIMSRFEAQNHLMDPTNNEASFLVRQSERDKVGYVLSVKSNSQVRHFKIFHVNESFYVEQNHRFSSLVDLVDHYCNNSLNNIPSLGSPCKRVKPNTEDINHLLDGWVLPKNEFTMLDKLGSGCFSQVYRGRWKNHINVAIKILKNDSLDNKEFQTEVEILKRLHHRHLISLFAVCTESEPYFIITELMAKGSLLEFLRGPEGKNQDIASLVDMATQVADGMSYLEEQNSIHRDLAARNVLVGDDYICKVADFGLARVIKEPFYISEDKKIPYKWCAPEAISHGMYSNKSDVWSFGILLFEIITYGGIPYPGFNNQEVYKKVLEGYRMEAPPKCPSFLYNLMLKCWQEKPEDRPDFNAIKITLERSSYELE